MIVFYCRTDLPDDDLKRILEKLPISETLKKKQKSKVSEPEGTFMHIQSLLLAENSLLLTVQNFCMLMFTFYCTGNMPAEPEVPKENGEPKSNSVPAEKTSVVVSKNTDDPKR